MALQIPKTILLLFILLPSLASSKTLPPPYLHHGHERINNKDEAQNYVVRVRNTALHGTNMSSADQQTRFYGSLLSSAGIGIAEHRLLHHYSNVMTGFAARLTKYQVAALSKTDWFANAYPAGGLGTYSLQTTYTPRFLGLERNQGLWNTTNMGEGIIIGVLDTDILPSHPSFRADGMPPPPSKWKGRCDFRAPYHCNNKLIGARTFVNTSYGNAKMGEMPRSDGTPPLAKASTLGHGTHTASTAAGNFVENASQFGSAMGIMSGIAPRAHIAFYKVCSTVDNCDEEDIVAAIVAATNDGVDVISLSIGGAIKRTEYDKLYGNGNKLVPAIGSFYAMSKGVFVSTSAGNLGPQHQTLEGTAAPWQLTVAASSTDRRMLVTVKLGNGIEIDGESIFQPKDHVPEQLPLVRLRPGANIKGKIVICEGACDAHGAAGIIKVLWENTGYTIIFNGHDEQYVLPASAVTNNDYLLKIKSYLESTTNPTAAIILKGTVTGAPWSPAIVSGSSRGPSKVTPGILKPDITGPGLNILAAFPFRIGPPSSPSTEPFFAIESGTSMSTPHLSGVAALIKKAHPDWSPAAIKSAMMTTVDVLDRSGKPIVDERRLPADLFALGAGHVNPSKAADPGLVYDISVDEYIGYMCGGLGYTDDELMTITQQENDKCSKYKKISQRDLNYPSLTISFASASKVSVNRTVTNVGEARSRYEVVLDMPKGISASAKPNYLEFLEAGEKKTFTVAFEITIGGVGGRRQIGKLAAKEGQLWLISRTHKVRSPISILFH